MDYRAMVGVLREAGVEIEDRPVLPGALGLPDGARARLLVDHDGLFRVYCAENLASTLPMSKVKGTLRASSISFERSASPFSTLGESTFYKCTYLIAWQRLREVVSLAQFTPHL